MTAFRHLPLFLFALLLFALLPLSATAQGLSSPYTDPQYQTKVPFGSHSHYVQPWRATLETVPARQFLNALGVVLDVQDGQHMDLIVQMLARHGIKNTRLEIGWGNLRYEDESLRLSDAMVTTLRACKRWGIRPLILLNGNSGVPCPCKLFDRAVTAAAKKGDRTVTLEKTDDLVAGRSGLSQLTGYWAAEALVTKIDGHIVTLSKPLPKDIPAGSRVPMATLKYRPFSVPGSADDNETLNGWKQYTETVTEAVTRALGTQNAADKGFDLEIWNEMSFGSDFISINRYYDPAPYKYNGDAAWGDIVKATADAADAHPAKFAGIQLCDGFSNTLPWQASSTEPARVHALSHHPYAGRKTFPKDDQGDILLDARLNEDRTKFVPAYTEDFPEYFATALQTEYILRDSSPLTTDIYGTKHGRFARVVNGKVVPCPVWITEVGYAPNEDGVQDGPAALALKGKTTARYFCFYVNKGVERLILFNTSGGDTWLGLVQDNFLAFCKTHTMYPQDDTSYTSPALRVTAHLASAMASGLDPHLASARLLSVIAVRDTHGHAQFHGDGTPAHPDLFDRDVLAILPYQVNARRFVIPYYVMTRDVKTALTPETFTVTLGSLQGAGAVVTAYDPILNSRVPLKVIARGPDRLTLALTATDYPYLLTVQEKPGSQYPKVSFK
jgi:hypothetical protein